MMLDDALWAVADGLDVHADVLGRLDAVAGDGDLGITAGLIAGAVRSEIANGPAAASQRLRGLGAAVAKQAPSSCGTLVATGLLRAAAEVDDGSAAESLADALEAAAAGIAERGGVDRGDRTMLDALGPAAEACRETAGEGVMAALHAAAQAAEDGAVATASMSASVGRAGWLSQRAEGTTDAGARLVAIAFRAAVDGLR